MKPDTADPSSWWMMGIPGLIALFKAYPMPTSLVIVVCGVTFMQHQAESENSDRLERLTNRVLDVVQDCTVSSKANTLATQKLTESTERLARIVEGQKSKAVLTERSEP